MSESNLAAEAPDVNTLRTEIDRLDDEILERVIARYGLSGEIAAAKARQAGSGPAQKPNSLALRTARESQILRRLLAQSAGRIQPSLIVEIWRSLMSSNLRAQTPFEVWVAPGTDPVIIWDLARRHFGGGTPMHRASDARTALQKVVDNPAAIAVMPFPGNIGAGGWWPILVESRSAELRIVGSLPSMPEAGKHPEAAFVARIALEPSGDDETLVIALDERGRAARTLAEVGFANAEEVERARAQALYRIPGFVAENDERILNARSKLDGLRVVGTLALVR